MSTLRLYGTVTSPYVRRVRIVAAELGLEHVLVDAFTEAGQAAMRAVNPLWKVPAIELDGTIIVDSRVIDEHLLRVHGPGPLAPFDPTDLATLNVLSVIDGALDALINTFYLARDGVTAQQSSYVAKQHERAASAMAWLEERVGERGFSPDGGFGLPEIALVTTIGWMRFRQTYDVAQHPALVRAVEHHANRPSVVATAPPA